MKITAIAAVDKSWGIGLNGSLLFRIREDLQNFKALTMGNVIIVGRKTLQTFPHGLPLAGRQNIILSSRDSFGALGGIRVCTSIAEIMHALNDYPDKEIFVAGGASVYKQMLPYCEKAIITKVMLDSQADCFMPNLDLDPEWVIKGESEIKKFESGSFKIVQYEKRA